MTLLQEQETRWKNFKIPYEVLVIDDGSVDRSPDISKAKEANVYRVTHQGKGYAIRFGFKRGRET